MNRLWVSIITNSNSHLDSFNCRIFIGVNVGCRIAPILIALKGIFPHKFHSFPPISFANLIYDSQVLYVTRISKLYSVVKQNNFVLLTY